MEPRPRKPSPWVLFILYSHSSWCRKSFHNALDRCKWPKMGTDWLTDRQTNWLLYPCCACAHGVMREQCLPHSAKQEPILTGHYGILDIIQNWFENDHSGQQLPTYTIMVIIIFNNDYTLRLLAWNKFTTIKHRDHKRSDKHVHVWEMLPCGWTMHNNYMWL